MTRIAVTGMTRNFIRTADYFTYRSSACHRHAHFAAHGACGALAACGGRTTIRRYDDTTLRTQPATSAQRGIFVGPQARRFGSNQRLSPGGAAAADGTSPSK
jgi:hypothetical protein